MDRLETHGEQKNRRHDYSRLDRLDGLPRCHGTHVIETDELPADGLKLILVSVAIVAVLVIIVTGWVLGVVLR